MSQSLLKKPILYMAFRPLYLLGSIYAILSILHWGFSNKGGNILLPGFAYHVHEMIWGYTGAIIVAFLLTAVATWTQQKATKEGPLLALVLIWIVARIVVHLGSAIGVVSAGVLTILFNFGFYALATYFIAKPIIRTKNKRNYIPIGGLFIMGVLEVLFVVANLATTQDSSLAQYLSKIIITGEYAGLMSAASFISLIGMRVIPFFIARRLGTKQFANPMWIMKLSMIAPIVLALLVLISDYNVVLNYLFGLASVLWGLTMLYVTYKWYVKTIWTEPLLWILILGFFSTSLGILLMGVFKVFEPGYITYAVHLITVGGIGMLTLGMMARTSLGHTGRQLRAPKAVAVGFAIMALATVTRVSIVFFSASFYDVMIEISAILFSLALVPFIWIYGPWFFQPRADEVEKKNVFKILQ